MRRVFHKKGVFVENELLSSLSEPQTPLSAREGSKGDLTLGHEADEWKGNRQLERTRKS